MEFFQPQGPETKQGRTTKLEPEGGVADQAHVFEPRVVNAVNAALAARRPLLVRGEPGTGKSQLARAVATEMKRPFVPFVVDSRTEPRDLLWQFDAVERLAMAQIAGALMMSPREIQARLATDNFLSPGPLWWAFDWNSAEAQAHAARAPVRKAPEGWDPEKHGCVVLIDEIDKAESDVPNGLLEALGALRFTPFGRTAAVIAAGVPPLVIITTNEERTLPDAFLRRCLVLPLRLPHPGPELVKFLAWRGRAHFEAAAARVLVKAARLLSDDRAQAIEERRRPRPGEAEYLDLVRAVLDLQENDPAGQTHMLGEIASFALRKHPDHET